LLCKVQRVSFTVVTWLKNITWAYELVLFIVNKLTTETCTPPLKLRRLE